MRGYTLATGLIFALLLPSAACITPPRHESATSQASSVESESKRHSRVNLNSASPAELEALPGIGKAIAERIVEHRSKYGSFRRPEHMMMVRGISDRKFRELRDLISVE